MLSTPLTHLPKQQQQQDDYKKEEEFNVSRLMLDVSIVREGTIQGKFAQFLRAHIYFCIEATYTPIRGNEVTMGSECTSNTSILEESMVMKPCLTLPCTTEIGKGPLKFRASAV